MVKIQILDKNGSKTKEMKTYLFEEPIRKDIINKIVEVEKTKQPYSPKKDAGMDRSASGNIRHLRHAWKSDRGRGLSRIPRKIFWRRGTQFSWEGAVVPGTKGGRRAHPPKGNIKFKKINKKEYKKALLSSLSYVSEKKEIKNKYKSLENKEIKLNLPLVVNEKFLSQNTKDFLKSLKKILGGLYSLAIPRNSIRAGIGKLRGRKNKKSAGILFVIGKKEDKKINNINVIKSNQLKVSDLSNNGARLILFSENAIKELEEFLK